jgi:putative endonuclease
MSFWVYILRCADGSYYTGHTDNLEKRIGEHDTGAIARCYTFKRRPLQLVFSQDCATREEALSAEQQIKGWSRNKKEAMMRGDWAEVSRLAKSHASVGVEPIDPQGNSAHPGSVDAALPKPCEATRPGSVEVPFPLTVRPEPVEGRNLAGGRPIEHKAHKDIQIQAIRAVPVHPSIIRQAHDSGRTEDEVEK